jgi:hypothetical protein
MKKATYLTLTSLLLFSLAANAQPVLIAGWNFDSAPGTNLADFTDATMPKSFLANFGSGTLYANGTNGSSNWLRQGELTSPQNSNSRQIAITTGATGNSLALVQPERATADGNDARGKSIVFAFSMETFASLEITYRYRRGSSPTFNELTWEISTNASDWSLHQSLDYPTTSGWLVENRLNPITGLSDASTAYVRITFNGASANPTSDREFQIDDIQFSATPIPEPAQISALLGLSIFGYLLWVRRHKAD